MKIVIFDKGDTSVGIHETHYFVDCPFSENDNELEDHELDDFKKRIIDIYANYGFGRITAFYDFELKKLEEDFMNPQNQEDEN